MPDQDDFARLRAQAEELARRLVDKHGISAPFAVVMDCDGVLRTIGVQSSNEANPRVSELVDGLVERLRRPEMRDRFRAVALCVHGYAARLDTGEQARAILINMEGRDGEARAVAIPHVSGLFGSVCYHEAVEQPGQRLIFGDQGAD